MDAKRMRKLKAKNLPKAMEIINRANQSEEQQLLQHLQKSANLDMPKPAVSD